MYFFVVITFMLVLPVGSIGLSAASGDVLSFALVAKWFVIWSVGARLLLAGIRQIVQPCYTAEVILSLKHEESQVLVREIGFGNLAIGTAGLASWLFPAWVMAAALAGAIFYCLAGFNHLLQPHRGKLENVAMISDLFVGFVLATAYAGAIG